MLLRKTIPLFIVFLLTVITGNLFVHAQLSVKGVVRDAETGRPIPNAAVFINTTTYGTVCTEDGKFELKATPALPFELTIAAVGYERSQLRLGPENATDNHIVELIPEIVLLEGVEIRPPVSDGWRQYGAKFRELFIGYSAFAAQCRILNEEVLDFYYDPDNFSLQVVANEPLKVENRATGYLVTYWLEDFEYSFLSGTLFYKGQSQFKPLHGRRKSLASRWADNRKSAYYGSLNHFIRSVYHQDAMAAGFEIRAMKTVKRSDTARFIPRTTDTFRFGNVEHLKAITAAFIGSSTDVSALLGFLQAFRQWRSDTNRLSWRLKGEPGPDSMLVREFRFSKTGKDSLFTLQYFEYPAIRIAHGPTQEVTVSSENPSPSKPDSPTLPPPVFRIGEDRLDPAAASDIRRRVLGLHDDSEREVRILFTEILPLDSIRKSGPGGAVQLDFEDHLQITYTKEKAERQYIGRVYKGEEKPDWRQESILSLRFSEPLLLQPDGNFRDPYNLFIESYWSYEKLDKLLPLDYQPEEEK